MAGAISMTTFQVAIIQREMCGSLSLFLQLLDERNRSTNFLKIPTYDWALDVGQLIPRVEAQVHRRQSLNVHRLKFRPSIRTNDLS